MSNIKRAAALIAMVGTGAAAGHAKALTVVDESGDTASASPANILTVGGGSGSGQAQFTYGQSTTDSITNNGVFTAKNGAAIGSFSSMPGVSSLDTYTVNGSTSPIASCDVDGMNCTLVNSADPYLHLEFDIGSQEELGYATFGADGSLETISYEAVPEPASWALMLTGVGVVGVALRRARRRARLATGAAPLTA